MACMMNNEEDATSDVLESARLSLRRLSTIMSTISWGNTAGLMKYPMLDGRGGRGKRVRVSSDLPSRHLGCYSNAEDCLIVSLSPLTTRS